MTRLQAPPVPLSPTGSWFCVPRVARIFAVMSHDRLSRVHTLGLLALPLLILVLAFGACSSRSGPDGGGSLGRSSSKAQPNTEEGLKAAVRGASEAVFSGKTQDAYKAFSKACREQVSYGDFAASIMLAKVFIEGFMQMKLSDIEVTGVDVRNFGPGKGEARTHTRSKKDASLSLDSEDDEFGSWIYEDGRWVQDDCSDMTFGDSAE